VNWFSCLSPKLNWEIDGGYIVAQMRGQHASRHAAERKNRLAEVTARVLRKVKRMALDFCISGECRQQHAHSALPGIGGICSQQFPASEKTRSTLKEGSTGDIPPPIRPSVATIPHRGCASVRSVHSITCCGVLIHSGTQIACPLELRRPAREFDSCHQSPRLRLRDGLPGIPGPFPWLPLSASTRQFRVDL